MKRWLKRLGLFILLLLLAAAAVHVYWTQEMLGQVEGFSWKNESETWNVTRPGMRLLIGTHQVGRTRPVSLTIRNSGHANLVMPYVARTGPNPWHAFPAQVKELTAGLADPADQIAVLGSWIHQRVKPASLKPSAGRRIVDPWTLIYSYGFGECLDLSYLLTTGASVLGLPVRVLDLQSHMVAEIRYGDAWHVYDLTYCYGLHDAQGRAPSFAEVSSGGGLKKWTDHHRPWLLGGLVNDTWRNLPTIAPQELPAGWDTAPEPLVLRPGDSWSLYAATVEKLRGARRSDEIDQPAALGVLDLAPSAGPRRMQLPFPLLRVLLTANGADEPLPLPVGVTLDRPPGYVVRNAWRRTAGGWELPLADLRTRIEPIKSFAVTIPDTLLTRARLRIEMACAASWLIAPDPGLTVLAVDWQDGDALELTLRWRQK